MAALGLIALSLLVAATLPARADVYTIDPAHSSIGFQVRHLVSKVLGRFTVFSGSIDLDPQKPENSTVDVSIDATSITTDTPKRDAHLKTSDFLAVDKFPTITFKSTKIQKTGENLFDVTGDLTIRGVTKSTVLKAEMLGVTTDPMMGNRAGFQATTTVNRKDFGVNWNKTLDNGSLLVGDDVQITLNVEAALKQAAAPTK
jgi:polyisoprenoid-binding protein YceI